jgi:hypothetical protein
MNKGCPTTTLRVAFFLLHGAGCKMQGVFCSIIIDLATCNLYPVTFSYLKNSSYCPQFV